MLLPDVVHARAAMVLRRASHRMFWRLCHVLLLFLNSRRPLLSRIP